MYISLGNLSVTDIERRSGITFSDEARKFLNVTHSPNADLSNGEWHCFDMPYQMTINEESLPEFEEKVFPFLRQGKPIQIGIHESDRSRNERLRKEKEIQLLEKEDIHFGNLQLLIRHLNLYSADNNLIFDKLVLEVVKPGVYKFSLKKNYCNTFVTIKSSAKYGLKASNTWSSALNPKTTTKNYNKVLYAMLDRLFATFKGDGQETIMNKKLNYRK